MNFSMCLVVHICTEGTAQALYAGRAQSFIYFLRSLWSYNVHIKLVAMFLPFMVKGGILFLLWCAVAGEPWKKNDKGSIGGLERTSNSSEVSQRGFILCATLAS